MNIKDKVIVYLYNKSSQFESEKRQIDEIRRYKPLDSLDYYEILRSEIKIECWNEFIDDLMRIIIYNYPQNK
ncbi:MAG: hypothetical protein IJZ21_05540 [Clostridia bacterium]|nr:hypothetical protein [Clostridia bacterium]